MKTKNGNVKTKSARSDFFDLGHSTDQLGGKTDEISPYPAEIQRIRKTPYGLRGFTAFCSLLRLEDGSPMELARFQKVLLGLYFAGVVELVIIMPKKNGKTTLMGALSLYHLLMIPAAECVIGAASQEQAAILHKQARTMVLQAKLDRRPLPAPRDGRRKVQYEGVFDVRPGIHEVRFELGRVRVLPADVQTVQGVIPTLALVDEYHCHPSSDLYAVFRDGLTPRNGQMITITNPGTALDSPLGLLRQGMRERPCKRQGRRREYRSEDGSTVLVEWGLEPGEDPDDLKLVKQANPAPWQTREELRRRRDSPSMTPGQWRRFGAGMWTLAEEPWIEEQTWNALRVEVGGLEEGERVWCAVRNGAVAIVAPRDEGVVCTARIGPDEFEATEDLIVELSKTYKIRQVAYDAQAFGRSADLLKARGIPMVETPHRPERLTQVSATLYRLVSRGLLHHDGDAELRDHVLAGTIKQAERGWRLTMTPENRGLIALAFAVHQAQIAPPPPKVHIWRGVA